MIESEVLIGMILLSSHLLDGFCYQWLDLNCFTLWYYAMGSDEVSEVSHPDSPGELILVAADSGTRSSAESGGGHSPGVVFLFVVLFILVNLF